MKKLSLFLGCLFFLHFKLLAAPALAKALTVVQKDSSSVTVFLRGDEHSHFYFTADNIPISQGADGSFYYVHLNDREVKISSFLAHNATDRNEKERKFLEEHAITVTEFLSDEWTEKASVRFKGKNGKMQNDGRKALGVPKAYIGNKKGLVILVNFTDKVMSQFDANASFDNMFNAIGYNKNGAIGSVHDYFYDQSYGQFNLTFDVVGPVTLEKGYAYYGENTDSGSGQDAHPEEMIVEACRLADAEVNFADYDWDGDGEVDQVYVIYAGYGENVTGASPDYIWPHKHELKYTINGAIVLDNITINTYACSCELKGFYGTTIDGIGTACHEFSHCLGLPDFYNTRYSGGFNMNSWDLMASGAHCGPAGYGEVPVGYTAYERQFAGWLETEELKSPCVITDMPCIGDSPTAYAIYNDNNRNEFFLLENRQCKRWYTYVDSYTDCHGLLITHVDYNEAAWRNNNVNNSPQHQRMAIIPADNSFGSEVPIGGHTQYIVTKRQYQGDLFPGLKNVTELTNDSHMNTGGSLFNINTDGTYNMNKPLTYISEDNGLISFYFMGGYYVPTPRVADATEISYNSFTANWHEVEEADSYSLELSLLIPQAPPSDNILIYEDMDKFKVGSSDGYDDIADKLSEFMDNEGWEGKTIFTSQYGAKIGTTSTKGYLISPKFNTGEAGLTIRFGAKAMTSVGAKILFDLLDNNDRIVESQEYKVYYQPNYYIINVGGNNNKSLRLRISSDDRFYLSSFCLYSGDYDDADFSSYSGNEHFRSVPYDMVEEIMGTSYHVPNLLGKIYQYRVKANMGKATSGWSSCQRVYLKGELDIQDVNLDKDIMVYDVYNLNGEKVNTIFQSGIYIVRGKSRMYKKIVIK